MGLTIPELSDSYLDLYQSLADQGFAKSLDRSAGLPAFFANPPPSRSRHIYSGKITQLRYNHYLYVTLKRLSRAQSAKIETLNLEKATLQPRCADRVSAPLQQVSGSACTVDGSRRQGSESIRHVMRIHIIGFSNNDKPLYVF